MIYPVHEQALGEACQGYSDEQVRPFSTDPEADGVQPQGEGLPPGQA